MTENDITVEAFKLYRLKTYGDVLVISISRQIVAANADGVVDEPIVVEFDIRPYEDEDEREETPYNALELGHTRQLEIGEFLDEVMTVKPESEQPRLHP